MNVALKEWACVVSALNQGFHHILLRKGGVADRGKRFEVRHKNFLLLSTLEHQKSEMIAPQYQSLYQETLAVPLSSDSLVFKGWAEVKEIFLLNDLNRLKQLSAFHIWSEEYLNMRLTYKPGEDLHLILLRTFRLFKEEKVKNLPQYGGCRSWVELREDVSTERSTPILSEGEFTEIQKEVKKILSLQK